MQIRERNKEEIGRGTQKQKKSSFVAHLLITAVVTSRWLGNEHDYSQSSPVLSSLVPIYKLAGERQPRLLNPETSILTVSPPHLPQN